MLPAPPNESRKEREQLRPGARPARLEAAAFHFGARRAVCASGDFPHSWKGGARGPLVAAIEGRARLPHTIRVGLFNTTSSAGECTRNRCVCSSRRYVHLASERDRFQPVDERISGIAGSGVFSSSRFGLLISDVVFRANAVGALSPRTSERCFTYCSQSVVGRTTHHKPWCCSLCIRRVFPHEVERRTRVSQPHARTAAAAAETGAKIPMPPESRTTLGTFLSSPKVPTTADQDPSVPAPPHNHAPHPHSNTESPSTSEDGNQPQYWQPGTYIWITRSAPETVDHIQLMQLSLEEQEKYQVEIARRRLEANEKWRQEMRKREQMVMLWPPKLMTMAPEMPFPEMISPATILLPLAPWTYVDAMSARITKYLQPTHKLVRDLQLSFEQGHQQDLAKELWNRGLSSPWNFAVRSGGALVKLVRGDGESEGKGGKGGGKDGKDGKDGKGI
ncbi:hypothetical protein EVG20_g5590 [Dentipellis fragilis]|uniref:Uncharacterized protein n=1 Tax=Dentipellis fragilis TaxID=205917 RepID=A0A4Y9YUL7_9AGAM|nr:hypothetical protein EVG20_g5590 [Dentipellis fragilis]